MQVHLIPGYINPNKLPRRNVTVDNVVCYRWQRQLLPLVTLIVTFGNVDCYRLTRQLL